ncbi:hypothetical protein D3C71_1988770 [compost metagenome]
MQQQPAPVMQMEQNMLRPALHKYNTGTKQGIFEGFRLHVNRLLPVYGHTRNRYIYKMLAKQPSVVLHFRQFRH